MTGRATTLRGTLSSLTSLRLAMIAMIMALPFLLPVHAAVIVGHW